MTVTFVTAYYINPSKFRNKEFYLENLEKLIQTGIPLLCYLDKSLKEQGEVLCEKYTNFKIPEYVTLDTSWIPEDVIMPAIRNEVKDTKEYFAIQLQKAWCLNEASRLKLSSHLAWIDAGIVYLFNDYAKTKSYLEKITYSEWPNELISPGGMRKERVEQIFGEGKLYSMFNSVCWQYLGSFLLGPTEAWPAFYEKQTACVKQNLPHLVWEVNYWALLNEFTWYWGDHNLSMLENLIPLALPPNDIILTDST